MKITIIRAQLATEKKPYWNQKTCEGMTEDEIVEMVTRKLRTRIATLEDKDDKLTVEIYIDDVNRD